MKSLSFLGVLVGGFLLHSPPEAVLTMMLCRNTCDHPDHPKRLGHKRDISRVALPQEPVVVLCSDNLAGVVGILANR